ncbi:MAG: LicD family protein [Oscillospiraceae bacterium]|nr:LicD family protein [Oscillospiraceae bacterium]
MVDTKHAFSADYFDEEERFGFKVDKARKEIWAVELDLLYELDRVCNKLSLQYSLAYGTLIGAVRDGRFIPWDDDIDVVMLREDYDVLISMGPDEFQFPYFLQTGYNDHDFFRGHAQLRNSTTCGALPKELMEVKFNQGIFIDIIVIDSYNDDQLDMLYAKKKSFYRKRRVMMNRLHGGIIRNSILRCWRPFLMLKYHDTHELYREYDSLFSKTKDGEFVDALMFWKQSSQIKHFKREWLEKTHRVPFEDGMFPIPDHYDEILSLIYGNDYMIPKMVSNTHNLEGQVIFDTNRSYLDVIKERRNSDV